MSKELKLTGHREIARGTFEFHFEKPAGFTFTAGQNINLKLPELRHEDPKGPRRTFTIASAPHEQGVLIATRNTGSGYKKTLLELSPGSLCEYLGPQGRFVLGPGEKNVVLLAGGIGITPFRSQLLHLEENGVWPLTRLIYGNADLAGAAYHDLFVRLSGENEHFFYIPTMANLQPDDPWTGERRMMDGEMIRHHVEDWREAVFYLCGPPPMVSAITGQLQSMGVAAEKIRSESLYGY